MVGQAARAPVTEELMALAYGDAVRDILAERRHASTSSTSERATRSGSGTASRWERLPLGERVNDRRRRVERRRRSPTRMPQSHRSFC